MINFIETTIYFNNVRIRKFKNLLGDMQIG